MDPRIIPIDREKFEKMYLIERAKINDIAMAFGISAPTVMNRVREFGIRRPASSLDLESVKGMYLDGGMSVEDIAETVGMTRRGVQRFIGKNGFSKGHLKANRSARSTVKVKLSADELRVLFLDQCLSDVEIGNRCGVCNITVANWRNKFGIRRSAPSNFVDIPVAELTRMYVDEKMKMEDIAKHFECGESTVRTKIVQLGLTLDSAEWLARRLERNSKKYARKFVGGGYRRLMLPNHPQCNRDGYVDEHRYNAEQAIGRYLAFGEIVHHIDLDKLNNDTKNLAVLPSKDDHANVHRYMERVAAYMCRLTDKKPAPVVFDRDVFWGGKWVRQIDLANRDYEVQDSRPAVGHMAFVN